MADQDRPNQNANKSKAEGDRSTADQQRSRDSARDEHPERDYPAGGQGNAGGITNRPLSDEVENQRELPDRGTAKSPIGNPDATRREGDYQGDER